MIPKQNRLKSTKAFNATYKNHHVISDDFICFYLGREKTDVSANTKIAFVVSKKIHKRAVVRNRIKRYMRESIRLALKSKQLNKIHKYISIICVAKIATVNADYMTLKSSIYNILEHKV